MVYRDGLAGLVGTLVGVAFNGVITQVSNHEEAAAVAGAVK